MNDTQLLDWLTENGASLIRKSQPDMGGNDWFVSHPLIASSRRIQARTPREAIELAVQRIKNLASMMSAATLGPEIRAALPPNSAASAPPACL